MYLCTFDIKVLIIMSNIENKNSHVNPSFSLPTKEQKPVDYYLNGLVSGDRYILSETITLLESRLPKKRELGVEILSKLPVNHQPTIRIGITGTPGVGKSTFIEAFGLFLIDKGHKPAILAIDPSSQKTKGSILGDKTRMESLSSHPEAYIRPSATNNVLGGTAAVTKETIQICESAGYDIIIVETVGVGQSETEVDNITDINILLLQPGAGDDIQGIKRGIMENADIFVINKSDGAMIELARNTKTSYTNAISLFHHDLEGWTCPVLLVSSIAQLGISEVYDATMAYHKVANDNGFFTKQRETQEIKWFEKQSKKMVIDMVLGQKDIQESYIKLLNDIKHQTIQTTEALRTFQEKLSLIINSK